ncbi:hypothetical protein DXT99_11380 [Pontibacter diazotrophicus]|uniref:Stress-induced protein n=1 Tax=Pontibacter diazotrophicus TaxID=1400979 RepID=A0A3D8LD25_9BACT|nr:hypothetical protein [Pontibacter diazotrophicus]RDV15253.1 hypothetical protein DXT99_11380 [Pontibacter diazotrophicus]
MEENKDKKHEQQGFSSNPEKSFEAGEKGGAKPAPKVTSQGSHNGAGGMGETSSRTENPNRPSQGEGWQSDSAGSEDAGKKD